MTIPEEPFIPEKRGISQCTCKWAALCLQACLEDGFPLNTFLDTKKGGSHRPTFKCQFPMITARQNEAM